uniref:Astacin domain-containing protein n=2 Tax=Strongyloides papillosus TaxID=174720 RepID=A0A0N5BPV3_STREA
MKTQKKSSVKTIKKTSVTRKPIPPKPNAMKTSSAKPTTRRVTTTTSTTKKTTKKEIKRPTPPKTTTRTTTKSTAKPISIKFVHLDALPPYHIKPRIYAYAPKNYQNDFRNIFYNISRKTGINWGFSFDKPVKNEIGINFNEISSGPNEVNISYNDNIPTEVYLHEYVYKDMSKLMFYFGLSLSLIPEVSRPDRNKYVRINYNNIKKDYVKYYNPILINFTQRNSDFDFGSSMLPDQLFGSIDNKNPTYTFKGYYNSYQKLSTNKYKYFSHTDYRLLWDFYRSNTCSNKIFWCKNGGYPDEFCNKCVCPSFFQGAQCENYKISSGSCGNQGNFDAKKELDFILYKNLNGDCYYTVQSNRKKKVKVRVERLIMPNTKCSTDDNHLGILYLSDKGVEPFTICQNTTSLEFSAASSEVYIHFKITKGPNLLAVSFQEVD